MSEVYGFESWLFFKKCYFFVFSENNLKNALENSNLNSQLNCLNNLRI